MRIPTRHRIDPGSRGRSSVQIPGIGHVTSDGIYIHPLRKSDRTMKSFVYLKDSDHCVVRAAPENIAAVGKFAIFRFATSNLYHDWDISEVGADLRFVVDS